MIPPQEEGVKKDLRRSVTMETQEDAEDMFVLAKKRLLAVNNWDKVSASVSGSFTIIDHNGHEVHRNIHKGDYIKIKIPAPASSAGEGFDWVVVQSIEYDDYPDENAETIEMIVHPCPPPNAENNDVAHFFRETSTSTFIIERVMRKVFAYYYGRNEVPNTDTEHFTDKARNVAVAIGAIAGLSDVQWDSLIKGFLEIEE